MRGGNRLAAGRFRRSAEASRYKTLVGERSSTLAQHDVVNTRTKASMQREAFSRASPIDSRPND
jgi:hypothetical protein